MYDSQIADAVEVKLMELDAVPVGSATGRRLDFGAAGNVDRRDLMRRSMADIAAQVGLHFFQMTPAVALEQVIIVSVMRNHDTAGLIKSLINSFMIAYCTPETSERAFNSLLELEALRREVAASRAGRAGASGTKH